MSADARKQQLLSTELLPLGKRPWYVSDAIEGVQVFGGTGSGKTSGSGRALALAFLKKGFGGLVLTAKPGERRLWEQYFLEAKRPMEDLVVVNFASHHHFNFLGYELDRAGPGAGITQNLVSLFLTALEPDGGGRSSSDPYWEHALRQLLTNAIDTVALANQPLTMAALLETILSAPRALDAKPAELEKSACARMLRDAWTRDLSAEARLDLEQCIAYWGSDFAALAERTRSVIVSTFTSRATSLMRGRLRSMFCRSDKPSFLPEHSHRGKVILLDLPVKEFGDTGLFAQVLFKTIWQRATERRSDMTEEVVGEDGRMVPNPDYNPDFRPVFLWADEAQHFATREDLYFQSTARSSLAATVYLTQNISNYYAVMGGREPRAATDSLLGNLVTKIFHANGDPTTNEWASSLFGTHFAKLPGFSNTVGGKDPAGHTSSRQTTEVPIQLSSSFPALKTGGPANKYEVHSIIFHPRHNAEQNAPTPLLHTFLQSPTPACD